MNDPASKNGSRDKARSKRIRSTPPLLFLAPASYRRRRLADAARLLPILGLFVFFIPLLWPGQGDLPMSTAVTYIFVAWAILILVVAGFGVLARRLEGEDPVDADEDETA